MWQGREQQNLTEDEFYYCWRLLPAKAQPFVQKLFELRNQYSDLQHHLMLRKISHIWAKFLFRKSMSEKKNDNKLVDNENLFQAISQKNMKESSL